MYKVMAIAGLAVCFAACNNSGNTSTESADKKQETPATYWEPIFDGKTLNGWHPYGGGMSAWKVADSAVYVDSTVKGDGADLITNDEYENYDLKLEWKISRNGNSGVIFNVHEDTAKYHATYQTGPEMQVIDNDGHPDGKIPKHRAGDLYDLISCIKETVKPVGEWNEAEIKVSNGKLDFYLNGTNVVSTTMWDDNWNKMVAGSKFKSMPGFGTFKKGHIALQDHGGDGVWYRNIKIMKL